jgi:MFS family permease
MSCRRFYVNTAFHPLRRVARIPRREDERDHQSLAWSVRSTFALFYVALLGVFSPSCGWLYDRWGARSLVPVGGLVLGAALALTGQSTTLWHYALAFGVLGAAGIASIQMPAAAIVSRWFVRSRGAALGVVSAGAKTSVVIFYPLNTWLIITLGWRAAFVVFALIVVSASR